MSALGFSSIGSFWRIVREFNPEGIEREATSPLSLWIAGESRQEQQAVASSLLGRSGIIDSELSPFRLLPIDELGEHVDRMDEPGDHLRGRLPVRHPFRQHNLPDALLVMVRLDDDLGPKAKRLASVLGGHRLPIILVFTHRASEPPSRERRNGAYRTFSFISHLRTTFLDPDDGGEVVRALGPMLLDAVPNARTSLARRLPPLRRSVADAIISETCRVNAQFALAANLPANLPLFGGVAGGIADFFVLTKNQVMMALRLGAIYGREIALTGQTMAELAPVIGGGILWRSAARLAAGMLPTPLAAAPKTAIAFVGTYIAGHAARYYLDEGREPPGELLRQLAAEGLKLYRDHVTELGIPRIGSKAPAN